MHRLLASPGRQTRGGSGQNGLDAAGTAEEAGKVACGSVYLKTKQELIVLAIVFRYRNATSTNVLWMVAGPDGLNGVSAVQPVQMALRVGPGLAPILLLCMVERIAWEKETK